MPAPLLAPGGALHVLDDGLSARIRFPDGAGYWVEPIASRVFGATERDYAVYATEAVLPNVGRCDHAYLEHVRLQRGRLADVTLFLKDTTLWHAHLASMTNVLGFVARMPADVEFFCARAQDRDPKTFELPRYESEQCRRFGNCYADETYVRANVRPLEAWVQRWALLRTLGERRETARRYATPWPDNKRHFPTRRAASKHVAARGSGGTPSSRGTQWHKRHTAGASAASSATH